MKEKLLGSAEWAGNTVSFRLSRDVDPKRTRRDLRDYLPTMSPDRAIALEQGRRVAHEMSVEARKKHATAITHHATSKDETVAKWCERWRAWRVRMGYVASDNEDAKNFRNYIEPVIGHRTMRLVGATDIEAIVEALDARIVDDGENGLSWKTARNAWVCVRAMFRDASTAKASSGLRVRDDNPTLTVAPPEKPKKGTADKLKTFLYPSEYLALMTAPAIWDPDKGKARTRSANVARAKAAQRWMRIFSLAIYNSMRANELKALQWEWIDLDHWIGKVEMQAASNADARRTGKADQDPKCGSFREFDFESEVRPLLLAMHAEAKAANGGEEPTGRIFPTFPTEKDLARRLRKYLELAGCKRPELQARNAHRVPMRFHDLRATGITWMAMRGDDAIHIQELAGHKSIVTTEKYIRKVRRIRGSEWGAPFPPIPVMVVGAKAASNPVEKSDMAPSRPKAGPNLAQEIANLTKSKNKVASPRGFEASAHANSPGEKHRFGSIGPKKAPDRHQSAAAIGSTDPVATALRAALEGAISEGRTVDAAALATELAARARAMSDPKVVPIEGRRR